MLSIGGSGELGASLDLILPSLDLTFSSQSGVFLTQPPSPVPIPAAAWLFASALGVFGYLGKRKASAQRIGPAPAGFFL